MTTATLLTRKEFIQALLNDYYINQTQFELILTAVNSCYLADGFTYSETEGMPKGRMFEVYFNGSLKKTIYL